MLKNNRKGLSDVITTVLIILLVLAAVVLIWSFIRRPLESGGKQIEASGQCLQLDLVPTACTNNSANATVTVQWKGGSDVELKKVKIVVSGKDGTNKVLEVNAPSPLATVSGTVNITGVPGPYVASVAGVVSTTDGSLVTCPESLTKISCG